MHAELVVVNHHLFFADADVRASGVAELLPSVRTVIVDEAHQISDIGVQFLGRRWSSTQAQALAQTLASQNSGPARGMADWLGLAADVARAAKALQTMAPLPGHTPRRAWVEASPDGLSPAAWEAAISDLLQVVGRAMEVCASLNQAWPELAALAQRCRDMNESIGLFAQARPEDAMRWVEVGAGLSLHQAPLSVAAHLRALLPDAAARDVRSRRAWIFTSATLGTDAQLSWFVSNCGLEGHTVLQVPSPFDYSRQAALYVPVDRPDLGTSDHSLGLAALLAQGIQILGGRTMVLTTTLRAMRAIAQHLSDMLAGTGIEVMVQGQSARRLLIENFLRAHDVARTGQTQAPRGSVLVASASFWEGVDIAGDALQMLVIDKLPFAPPDDPIVQARAMAIECAGGKAFKTLHLPLAALALKQGAGRLIRSESDRGVLVVCDPRLVQKAYGKKLLAALPPMRVLHGHAQWLDELVALRQAPALGVGDADAPSAG